MLDDDRLRAVQNVIDSLPLSDSQLELAHETINALSAGAADELIKRHQRLIDSLPRALEAIQRVRRQRRHPSKPRQD